MRQQKSIVITPEAVRFQQFVQQLLAGSVEPEHLPDTNFGEWHGHAAQLFEAYAIGYSTDRKREGAISFVQSALYTMSRRDDGVQHLLSIKTQEDNTPLTVDINDMPPLPESVYEGEENLDTDLARKWLDAYMKWSQYWSPRGHDIFHEAIGIWILSLLAARRIVIPIGEGVYTPLYFMLAADTSAYAKSFTLSKAKALLNYMEIGHMLLRGEMTPEVFIRSSTGKAPDNWEQLSAEAQAQELQELAFSGQRGICYDEFGAQLSSMSQPTSPMKGFYRIFLTWADCPKGEDAAKITIGRGKDIPRNPYLAAMTCLTIANVNETRAINPWSDGFFARWAIICPPRDEYTNEEKPDEAMSFPAEVTDPLMHFYERLGVPKATDVQPEMNGKGMPTGKYRAVITPLQENKCSIGEGVRAARKRYSDALFAMRKANLIPEEFHGNYTRFPEMALRIAALLAWMNNGGCIELEHYVAARKIVERWRASLHEFYRQLTSGKTSYKSGLEKKAFKFIDRYSNEGGLTASEVAARISELDSKTAYEMLESMAAIGKVAKYTVPCGKAASRSKVIYKVPEAEPPVDAIYEETKEQSKK